MDEYDGWDPRCELPRDLVRPSRIDPSGTNGPTRGQAQGGRWRAVAHGWHLPTDVDSSRVEQRILEQAMRVRTTGAVTAWASLRWQGAAYFDGTVDARGGQLAVPLLRRSGGRRLRDQRAAVSRRQLPPYDRVFVRGVWCATPERAVFDEVHRLRTLRPAVTALCMTLAAGLTTLPEVKQYSRCRTAWEAIPLFREVLTYGNECFRSPQEVRMHLAWRLDADLPEPLVNPPVFDLDGHFVGIPDLLDPVAGVVGEYAGAAHRSQERHRSDVRREERFRDVGLEPFTVVAGDLADRALVVARMRTTRGRARFLPPEERRWTLVPPPWWRPPPWLAARYLDARILGPAA
ncbi:hypothetical protein [Nocardioides sp. GXQ0305]|uniref:hypothetical protein n=1 Tax=Nocardioides sp. GXQ0305 TaxID=3423912 RepID=UPI003D7D8062